jgi:hypothetical protein
MMEETLSKPKTVEQLDAKAGCPALPCSPLVLIRPGLILNRSQIREVVRCGNYTSVTEVGGKLHQEWDEDFVLWNRILGENAESIHPESGP